MKRLDGMTPFELQSYMLKGHSAKQVMHALAEAVSEMPYVLALGDDTCAMADWQRSANDIYELADRFPARLKKGR